MSRFRTFSQRFALAKMELTRFVDDGRLPADNNWIENQIRPIAIGRSNWLFAGSLRAGQRAAAVMSLIQPARMNRHDPYAYLKCTSQRALREVRHGFFCDVVLHPQARNFR